MNVMGMDGVKTPYKHQQFCVPPQTTTGPTIIAFFFTSNYEKNFGKSKASEALASRPIPSFSFDLQHLEIVPILVFLALAWQ